MSNSTEYDVEKTPELTHIRDRISKIFPKLYAGDKGERFAAAESVKAKKWWLKLVSHGLKNFWKTKYDFSVTNIQPRYSLNGLVNKDNKIPRSGPLIYVSYHGSTYDPFMMGPHVFLSNNMNTITFAREDMFSPDYFVHLQRSSFEAKHERLGTTPTELEIQLQQESEAKRYAIPFNWLFRSCGAVPITRAKERRIDDLVDEVEIRNALSGVVFGDEPKTREISLVDVIKLKEQVVQEKGGKLVAPILNVVERLQSWHSRNKSHQMQPMVDSLKRNEAVLIFPQGGRDRGLGLDQIDMGGLDQITSIEGVTPQLVPLFVAFDDIGLNYIGQKKKVIINAGDSYYRDRSKSKFFLEKDTLAAMQGAYVAGFDDIFGRMMINWADSYGQRRKSYSATEIAESFYDAVIYLRDPQTGVGVEKSIQEVDIDSNVVGETINQVVDGIKDPLNWEDFEFSAFKQLIGDLEIGDIEKRMVGALAYMEKKEYLERDGENRYSVGDRLRTKPERGRSYETENKIRQRSNRFTTHIKGAYEVDIDRINIF